MTKNEMLLLRARETNAMAAIQLRLSGLMTLYDSACFAGNGQYADEIRGQIHQAYDELFDKKATTWMLTRQLSELPDVQSD